MATVAGGTHPTKMHSCLCCFYCMLLKKFLNRVNYHGENSSRNFFKIL